MKKSFVVSLFIILINNTYSQPGKSADSKFKISLSQGVTYNFDKNISADGDVLDPSASSFTVNMTNFEAGYFISKHHEIGLSIGKNSFTHPQDYVYSFSIENNDTTFLTASGNMYIEETWFALYYNFHFLDSYKAGIRVGELRPEFFENSYNTYINLSVGKYYKITDNFLMDVTINYSNRNRDLKYFKSNQLGLSIGFNLKI